MAGLKCDLEPIEQWTIALKLNGDMMRTQFGQKDTVTEQLKQLITRHVSEACETNRAEASLTALSFQSLIVSERHVWIETDINGTSIDLEDWTVEDERDNVVACIDTESFAEIIEVMHGMCFANRSCIS
jgi:hypothetical protein